MLRLALLTWLLLECQAFATIVDVGEWQGNRKKPRLVVQVDDQLKKKQVELINSGFSTYTSLKIILPAGKTTPEMVLDHVECTVKYDTWEEYYDIVRLGDKVQFSKIKDFATFTKNCLTATVKHKGALHYFRKNGGFIWAELRLDQIAPNRAKEIREWLIKQQTGVVKGLFTHILGDLKLSEILRIKVQINPLAQNQQESEEIEVMALYPELHPEVQTQ